VKIEVFAYSKAYLNKILLSKPIL